MIMDVRYRKKNIQTGSKVFNQEKIGTRFVF